MHKTFISLLKSIYLFIFLIFSYLLANEKNIKTNLEIQFDFNNSTLNILSWNIKMLPPPYGWIHNPNKRANNIIQTLKKIDKYDIILFQEAFSVSIRKIIFNSLKYIYPYQIKPENNTSFYKSNSGLWVISKLPISLIDETSFSSLRKWDKLASKGAKLYSIKKNNQNIYLINTHMQADYQIKYNETRVSQYIEIQENLISKNINSKIPIILCGDLNISNPIKLKQMLKYINFINIPLKAGLNHSTIGKNPQLLDYILLKSNNFEFQSVEQKIIDLSSILGIKPIELSDHYPIEGILKW